MIIYTIKKLAESAGVSVRTLHYYDEVDLLKPQHRNEHGYRYYGEDSFLRLQQILFFRELGFKLDEIKKILSSPDFDVLEALQSHRALLIKQSERVNELIITVDRTLKQLKGEIKMKIKEYYQGFSDEQIEKYREEVRLRWGEKVLQESEARVLKMSKPDFTQLQTEGRKIFEAISLSMSEGFSGSQVQRLVAEWRRWLENFYHYPDEAVLGLGREYSTNPEFAKYFQAIHPDLPDFLTKAIEYYCTSKEE